MTHTHTASGKTTRTEVYTYTYDHADRISKVQHSLGSTAITLYDATYDNFGRLLTKQYHGTSTNKLTYTYNLRSWLTGISGTRFTQNLYYNTGVGTAKYNGSISSMTWKSGNESTVRGYKFTYDGLDRMLNATYGETASISTNANRFSENVTGYDKNGNIKGLQRYGQTGASAYGLLDNLTFTLNGNQLSRVEDAVSTAAYGTNTAFVNGASAAGEYAYDVNGNLTKDLNKGITDIQYNVLNLPSTVSFSDGSTITYTYGADGTKLRQAYAYNVRGWLTGISGTKFTQNLYYNTGNGPAKYNGSISSMTWKAGTASTVRGYKSTYDGLDRLLNATYGETAGISTNANRFSENVTGYDKNGNIKGLQRYGQTGASAYGLLDNLTFTLNGNQLSRVEDAVSTAAYGTNTAFVNGASAAGEYAYDVNGNLTKDLNKGITDIQYNVLNLPSTVSFSDGSTITYTYGADGTKLRTVHKIGSTTTTTDYCGNVIYENGTQKLLLTEEGYINLAGTQQYHYYLKDHQGNNRVVINRSGTMEETNHYYPFGGVFATAGNTQPYKYNGKEFDTKKGLNWYDYGARHYDTALGRFMTNDRFAEKYYSMSPYQYGANSPVVNIDVNGDSIRICTETQSFGHTWISVGEGSNMTVYSYGRYNGTNKGQIEALIL